MSERKNQPAGVTRVVSVLRMFRTAHNKEFIQEEIEPRLVKYGLPLETSKMVAQLVNNGLSVDNAVHTLSRVWNAYLESDDG